MLLPCHAEHLLVLIEQPDRFSDIAGYTAAEGMAGFFDVAYISPKWLAALRTAAGPDPWRHGFFVVEREARQIVGTAGFKGAPDAEGVVEIAYGIVPARQGQGFATEAAEALVRYASADARVRLVRAHTLPEANASTRVLTKCGFRHVGGVIDPEDGPVWRWERPPAS